MARGPVYCRLQSSAGVRLAGSVQVVRGSFAGDFAVNTLTLSMVVSTSIIDVLGLAPKNR